MSKRILVISTSLREKSNSQALGDAFAAGAREAGHQVEQISLRGRSIAFCMGCLACQSVGQCVIQDDAVEIAEKMGRAEVIAFATPIYYYEMCGQMKTMLDRANPLYDSDYQFRDVYLLASAAETEKSAMDGAIKGISGWIECFPNSKLAGTVFGGGADVVGAIQGNSALQEAYELDRKSVV